MAQLTKDVVRALARSKAANGPVVSLFLDVDGRRYVRPHDYEVRFDALLRDARANGEGDRVAGDLGRIEAFVKAGFDRSRTRGLALFAAGGELLEVVELPVPVRNHVVVNQTPYVRPLEAIVDNYERFGVLLVDRQRGRIFVFELGQLSDRSEVFDQLPRQEDPHGDKRKDDVHDHVVAAAHHHLRHAARVAFEVYQQAPFDHLIVATPDDLVHELENELHSYLRGRIAAHLTIPIAAKEDDIRTAAMEVEEGIERAKEAALVTRLREDSGRGRAVVGLNPTLQTLVERRVETLLVSDGYEAPGWRCGACGFVGTRGRRCPVCSAEMHEVADVVEEAVEEALNQSCHVEVCVGNADLDVLGRIGALLRY